MQIKRVKVTKADQQSYWYADKIGQEFHIFEVGYGLDRWRYMVIHAGTHDSRPTPCYLDEGDVDVLEVFDAEVVEQVTISIQRKVDADETANAELTGGPDAASKGDD
ncbi:MAG: hypothetical protein ACRCV5_06245 [Afipia sp.]